MVFLIQIWASCIHSPRRAQHTIVVRNPAGVATKLCCSTSKNRISESEADEYVERLAGECCMSVSTDRPIYFAESLRDFCPLVCFVCVGQTAGIIPQLAEASSAAHTSKFYLDRRPALHGMPRQALRHKPCSCLTVPSVLMIDFALSIPPSVCRLRMFRHRGYSGTHTLWSIIFV